MIFPVVKIGKGKEKVIRVEFGLEEDLGRLA